MMGTLKHEIKKWLKKKLEPLEQFLWIYCCVPLLDRLDKEPKVKKRNNRPSSNVTGTQEQFTAYRTRKKLLAKRMRFGIIAMCCLIIFLAWLQYFIPTRHQAFWSTGKESETDKKMNLIVFEP